MSTTTRLTTGWKSWKCEGDLCDIYPLTHLVDYKSVGASNISKSLENVIFKILFVFKQERFDRRAKRVQEKEGTKESTENEAVGWRTWAG